MRFSRPHHELASRLPKWVDERQLQLFDSFSVLAFLAAHAFSIRLVRLALSFTCVTFRFLLRISSTRGASISHCLCPLVG